MNRAAQNSPKRKKKKNKPKVNEQPFQPPPEQPIVEPPKEEPPRQPAEPDPQRLVRKLNKKLKQIEQLKDKLARGDILNPDQLKKVDQEKQLKAELREKLREIQGPTSGTISEE